MLIVSSPKTSFINKILSPILLISTTFSLSQLYMIIPSLFLFLSFLVYHNLYNVQFLQISPILTQSPEGTLCLFSFSSQSLYLLFPLVSPLKILYSKCLYKTYSPILTSLPTLVDYCPFLTTPECQCSVSLTGKALWLLSNLCSQLTTFKV